MENIAADLRYAVRSLLKAPSFAVVATLTLALGIGANAAMFGVIDTVLFRPLPYPDADRLVSLTASDRKSGAEYTIFGMPDLQDLRAEKELFEGVAAYLTSTAVMRGDDTIERVKARQVSGEFFTVLGVPPQIGRWLGAGDAPGTAVIAHDFWRRRFGADMSVIGRTLDLGDIRREIVGVMPAGFDFPARADLWTPIEMRPMMAQRGVRALQAVGRLNPHMTIADANIRMAALSSRMASDFPRSHATIQTRVTPLHDALLGSKKLPLIVLFGAVIAILLVAVANVAALTSVRSAQRSAEFAIRASLGAGRGRIIRLIMAESAVLAAAGATTGVLIAYAILGAVKPLIPEDSHDIALNARVIVFSLATMAVTALLFGLLPAREASGSDTYRSLKEESSGGIGQTQSRLRSALLGIQVAATLVLVIVAALMLNSFARLRMVNLGIDPENVVTFSLQGSVAPGSSAAAEYARISDEVLARLQSHPDVRAAARSSVAPLRGFSITGSFRLEGASRDMSGRSEDDANLNIVSADYFHAAILLYFEDADAVSVHTLVGAAHILITDLSERLTSV